MNDISNIIPLKQAFAVMAPNNMEHYLPINRKVTSS